MSYKTSLLLSLLFHSAALAVLAGVSSSPAGSPGASEGSGGEGGGGLVIGIRPPGAPVPAPTASFEREGPTPEEASPGLPAPPAEPTPTPLSPPIEPVHPAPPGARESEAESLGPGADGAAGMPGVEGAGFAEPGSLRPVYPASCRRLGHQGIVFVRVIVNVEGKPCRAEVARSAGCPDLDRAALEAVLGARFRAARRWGKPVESTLEQPFRFELTGR